MVRWRYKIGRVVTGVRGLGTNSWNVLAGIWIWYMEYELHAFQMPATLFCGDSRWEWLSRRNYIVPNVEFGHLGVNAISRRLRSYKKILIYNGMKFELKLRHKTDTSHDWRRLPNFSKKIYNSINLRTCCNHTRLSYTTATYKEIFSNIVPLSLYGTFRYQLLNRDRTELQESRTVSIKQIWKSPDIF